MLYSTITAQMLHGWFVSPLIVVLKRDEVMAQLTSICLYQRTGGNVIRLRDHSMETWRTRSPYHSEESQCALSPS